MPENKYSAERMEAFAGQLRQLAKHFGFPSFVMVAHNCSEKRSVVLGNDLCCGHMKSVYGACDGINKAQGVTLTDSTRNN